MDDGASGDGRSLLDAAELIRGVSYKREEARDRPGPGFLPIVRANNIQDGRLVLEDLVYVPTQRISEPQRIRAGDIVIAMSSGSSDVVGKAAIALADWHGGFGAFCGVLRAKPGTSPAWLAHFMKSSAYRAAIDSVVTGTNINNLTKTTLASVRIPTVPEELQERVGRLLDRLDHRKDSCSYHLVTARRSLDRFRQSVFEAACLGRLTADWRANLATKRSEVLDPMPNPTEPGNSDRDLPTGWTYEAIGSLFRIQNGRAFPSKEYLRAGGIRLLRPGNLNANGLVAWSDDRTVRLPMTWADRYPEFVLGTGELVMNLTAQSLKDEFLGRACIKADGEPALLNQRIARFVNLNDHDSRRYALIYFKSPLFRRFVNGLDSGTLIRHMHSKQLQDHLVPTPPPDEQDEIVRRVAALLETSDSVQKHLDSTAQRVDQGMSFLLTQAIRGDLVGLAGGSSGG